MREQKAMTTMTTMTGIDRSIGYMAKLAAWQDDSYG
jgi:hypothetical protein